MSVTGLIHVRFSRSKKQPAQGVAWHGLDRAIAPSFVDVVIKIVDCNVRAKAVYSIYTTLSSSLDLPLILPYQSIRSQSKWACP